MLIHDVELRRFPKLRIEQRAITAAAKRFRVLWLTKRAQEDDEAVPSRIPGVVYGGCVFATATAIALFGGEVRANWHHTWVHADGAALDLTGLHDVPIAKAVAGHAAYLRRRGYTLTAQSDGTYAITLEGLRSQPTYPALDTQSFLTHDPAFVASADFCENFASVIPRSLRWADDVRAHLGLHQIRGTRG
jgi:hypothetical protein